jgi:predicted transcriptional regulator
MARRRKIILYKRELQAMKVLWEKGEATVADVQKALSRGRRRLAYTTIATLMGNMEKKGYVTHKVSGRTYVYKPRIKWEDVSRGMLMDLLERVFDGSPEMLISTLVESISVDKETLESIKRRIEEIEREREGK